MTFATPLLLLGLALLGPVLVAFLVRFRRDVVKVPSTLLYRLAGARVVPQRRFRNVRRWLAVLMCLAGVAAIVVAAARPSAKSRGETVAIVIDVSASMSAGGRDAPLVRAKAFAARRISGGGPRDRYALIAAGAIPRRIAGPAAPGVDLDAALEHLEAENGTADLTTAIELAGALVTGAPDPHVLVLGDGGTVVAPPQGMDAPLAQRIFRAPSRDDLGVAGLTSKPIEGTEAEREIAIEIATSSDKPRRARVVLTAEGRAVLDRVVDVPARGEADVHARVVSSAAEIVAKVSPADGIADALAIDDVAAIHGGASARQAVLLVAPGDSPARFFVEKAIAAAGSFQIVPASPSLEDVKLDAVGIAVVLDAAPVKKLDVPALYVGAVGGSLPFSGFHDLAGDAANLRSVEAKDPLLRGVALDGVTIEHATAVNVPPGARALVDLDGGSVVVAGGARRARWMYLGIDAARSDLALRVAFPVLVANALHALGGTTDVVTAETVARSEIALADAPENDVADEPLPRWRVGIAPALLVALIGALLLGLEAWTWRKGWANA
jgi:hypothetical protein